MSSVTEDVGEEFKRAYERHGAEILRYAIRCTGRRDIAEDITSDAFLKMFQHREQIDFSRAGAWLTAVVKRMSIDYWRRVELERREQNRAPEHTWPLEQPWEKMLGHPSLNAEHRICLTLRYVHGMEAKEITSHTGLAENQVKNALQYGLKLLRKSFGAME
jgi:RNA polymerase sigma-70 factor (ECF subfamily)